MFKLFDDYLQAELYNARSHDIGESTTKESAMSFKEDFIRKNTKASNILNLSAMRLGINALVSLAAILSNRKVLLYTGGKAKSI